jgi:glycosyltransferase involved in cell wall biosynthesis
VVITCYNRQHLVGRAITSVLRQKCDFPLEVIVVDDGSTDKSVYSLMAYQSYPMVRLILNSHQGVVEAYRTGINAANGTYIALLDSDDYWIDDYKLSKQVDEMEKGYALCYTGWKSDHGVYHGKVFQGYDDILKRNPICASTAMFVNVKGLMDSFRHFNLQDLPLWLWMSRHGGAICLPGITTYRNVELGSYSVTKSKVKRLKYVLGIIRIEAYFILRYGCKPSTLAYVVWHQARNLTSTILGRWH